jgi:hemoglobin
MQLVNYLFFTVDAEPALEHYTRCGLGRVVELVRHADGPRRGKIMHARFEGPGIAFCASDNTDAEPMRGSAHFVELDDRAAAERLFAALADGGTITTPIGPQPWSPCYGKLTDRFGVQWMVSWRGTVKPSIYEAAGKLDGILRLAHAWHERCLADPIVSHAFSHGFHPQHTERLAAYWAEALGGPSRYTASLGDETGVVRMHAGNGEHVEMDERAIACFAHALDDAGFIEPGLRATLLAYFRWATGTMAKHPRSPDDVPAGLQLARWSWDGAV